LRPGGTGTRGRREGAFSAQWGKEAVVPKRRKG